MQKRTLTNPGLKIISLVVAVIIWLVISNINDPIVTKNIKGVSLRILNASYLESMGQSYQLREGYDNISVKVKGNRSIVDDLVATDIEATADLTEIVSLESQPITVPIRISVGRNSSRVTASATPSTVQIDLEELISEDFLVTSTAGVTAPQTGYAVAKLAPSLEKVTITGPVSMLSIIDKVVAPVDVSNLMESRKMNSKLIVYDKNGAQLTDTQMSYLRFGEEASNLNVYVTIYRVINDVKLKLAGHVGYPKDGYQVAQITLTPSTISVAGTEEALADLVENNKVITLDESLVDVSGADSSFDIRIENLDDYLPENLILNSVDSVVASVEVLPYNSKLVKIPTSAIEKLYLANDLNCVFSSASVAVPVQASDVDLRRINPEDISASVDLSIKGAGTYTVDVAITLPSGYKLVENVSTTVVLSGTESHLNSATADTGNTMS